MLDLFPNDSFKHTVDIKYVIGFLVKVEIYKFKGNGQCYNCQRFNHLSEISSFNPMCLRSSDNHLAIDFPGKDPYNIKCVKCIENHVSNFGVCARNPKIIRQESPSNTAKMF